MRNHSLILVCLFVAIACGRGEASEPAREPLVYRPPVTEGDIAKIDLGCVTARPIAVLWLVLSMAQIQFAGSPTLAGGQSPAAVGVPSIDPDYDIDVCDWWAKHPFNDRSATFQRAISSPDPVVSLQPGDSIDDAVRQLPERGGTLRLAVGQYAPFAIIGRSNIHILGPEDGEAVILGHSYLANCPEAMNYVTFDRQVSHVDSHKYKDKRAWELYKNPTRNFVLRNLIFDGEGKTVVDFPGTGIQGKGGALGLKRVRDVVVEGCTFRNYLDAAGGLQHGGLAWGHYGITNIWFRDCKFLGTARYAIYLDGAHASGLIGCTIDGQGCKDGGLLFLTNHDFTDDVNENGVIDPPEEKCAKYVVIIGNTFNWSRGTPIRYTGRDLLVERNQFAGLMLEAIGIYSPGEVAHRTWPIGHSRIRVLDNTIGTCARAVLNIFEYNADNYEKTLLVPEDIRYTMKGNVETKTPQEVRFDRPKAKKQ